MAAFSRFERPSVERDRAFVPRVPQRGVAMYLQVADYLRGRIESGRLSPGDQLPPETKRAESFHVSRHTIREALPEGAGLHRVSAGERQRRPRP